jgi:two-component system sensor histidine kinase DesK
MTSMTLDRPAGFPAWAVRRALWFLIAIHLPFIVFPPLNMIAQRPDRLPAAELALFAAGGLVAGALQLRHSLATARDRKPRGWPLTLIAVAAISIVPDWWFAAAWSAELWFVIASALMLLPRLPARAAAAAAVAAGSVLYLYQSLAPAPGIAVWRFVIFSPYIVVILALGGGALYGSARLVAILGEVFAARTQLAEQSLARERLRIARDLHDLLGQSLSAVSLKGDLALALLTADPAAAEHEIQSLTAVARGALRDMRAITRDEHDISLAAETGTAVAVLQAAGITVRADATVPDLAPACDAVLAWAVREGTTNILRHSHATEVRITARRTGALIRLDITNDGAPPPARYPGPARPPGAPPGAGTGLAGLADRARAAGGTAAGEYRGPAAFRLRVELAEERP